jgi:hypothetical protein
MSSLRKIISEELRSHLNEVGEFDEPEMEAFDESEDELKAEALSIVEGIVEAVNGGNYSGAADQHYYLGQILMRLSELSGQ